VILFLFSNCARGENLLPNQVACNFNEHNFKDFPDGIIRACDLSLETIDDPEASISNPDDRKLRGLFSGNRRTKFIPVGIVNKFPKLFAIEFSKSSIKTIEKHHFESLRDLEVLDMNNNQIEYVEIGSFDDLTDLISLDLQGNKIEFLNQKLFVKLGKLQKLYLSHNEIQFLPGKIFEPLRQIESLTFYENQITFLNENIFANNEKVKNISFSNNLMSELPENLFAKNRKIGMVLLHENNLKLISSSIFDDKYELLYLDLRRTCENNVYDSNELPSLKNNLQKNCNSPREVVKIYRENMESVWRKCLSRKEEKVQEEEKLKEEISKLEEEMENLTKHAEKKGSDMRKDHVNDEKFGVPMLKQHDDDKPKNDIWYGPGNDMRGRYDEKPKFNFAGHIPGRYDPKPKKSVSFGGMMPIRHHQKLKESGSFGPLMSQPGSSRDIFLDETFEDLNAQNNSTLLVSENANKLFDHIDFKLKMVFGGPEHEKMVNQTANEIINRIKDFIESHKKG
jgi:hypothetical protein